MNKNDRKMVVLLNRMIHNAMYSFDDFHDYVNHFFNRLSDKDPKIWQQYLEFRDTYWEGPDLMSEFWRWIEVELPFMEDE